MPRSNWTPEISCLILVGALVVNSEAWAQTVSYRYDALGRLIEVQRPDGSKTTYTYDAADNRVTVTAVPPPPPSPPPPVGGSIVPWLSVVLG